MYWLCSAPQAVGQMSGVLCYGPKFLSPASLGFAAHACQAGQRCTELLRGSTREFLVSRMIEQVCRKTKLDRQYLRLLKRFLFLRICPLAL